jgi:hypothetical protein
VCEHRALQNGVVVALKRVGVGTLGEAKNLRRDQLGLAKCAISRSEDILRVSCATLLIYIYQDDLNHDARGT